MKILFLEDRGSVSHYWKEMLEEAGHVVHDASNLSRAKSYLVERDIDCLLIDSNLKPEGLSAEQVEKTMGGVLTGWVWLQEYAFEHNPSLRNRTIILTGYIRKLTDNIRPEYLEEVYVVDKQSVNPAKRVKQFLNEIKQASRRQADE